jgi:hypothetical protein
MPAQHLQACAARRRAACTSGSAGVQAQGEAANSSPRHRLCTTLGHRVPDSPPRAVTAGQDAVAVLAPLAEALAARGRAPARAIAETKRFTAGAQTTAALPAIASLLATPGPLRLGPRGVVEAGLVFIALHGSRDSGPMPRLHPLCHTSKHRPGRCAAPAAASVRPHLPGAGRLPLVQPRWR